MQNTIIFYATAGIGHKKAAFAVKEAFDENRKSVLIYDVLDYTNKFFKFSYNTVYLFLVKYLPTIWGFFYYILDNPLIYLLVRPLRRLTNQMNSKKLVKFLLKAKPDTVIATHFFPIEVIAHLKKKGILNTRLIAVVTDYKSHTFWLSKHVDLYLVGAEYTRDDLTKRGIPFEKIRPFGIPCAKSFSEKRDPETIKKNIGLLPGKNTVFVLGGGFGVGPIKSLVRHLDTSDADFQGIVVCGYNKKLYNAIAEITKTSKHKFKVYGFVNNVDELMAASDVLVSKSGGITVTEALNASLPMIVIDPIPGQEMRNYKFLEKNDAALEIRRPKEIADVVAELFNSDKLKVLKNNIKTVRLVGSAERIVDEICK